MRFLFDDDPVGYQPGDSIAVALVRAGLHPARGGCLCLAGDCPHCLVSVDGVAFTRACQTTARPGLLVRRHPQTGWPAVPATATAATEVTHRHRHCDVVVVGGGNAGSVETARLRAAGRDVAQYDSQGAGGAEPGEAIGVYAGPVVVVRTPSGIDEVHSREVVVATGASEYQPVCDGAQLAGIVTRHAAELLAARGALTGRTEHVSEPPARFEAAADGRLGTVVYRDEVRVDCDVAVITLGSAPRDALARQAAGLAVRVVGAAAETTPLPAAAVTGVVCPCTGVTTRDLDACFDRGFRDIELLKRATLAGTGACQGATCTPYLRSFLTARGVPAPEPFTARPLARQLTIREAATAAEHPAVRRTTLDQEHRSLGARMERFGGWWRPWTYGDHDAEYWAVREAVSVGDVSTLGRMLVSGPDAVALLEYIYPCRVADLAAGQARYALMLNEAGYVFDDGMILRLSDTRFLLTFTTGGASHAEAWMRDWAEARNADVRILDRTAALGAINVTGPLAGELLRRVGVADPPRYLRHADTSVTGVRCRILRLGFTGEASFELHHEAPASVTLWRTLLGTGGDLGVRPHGLEALLTLRLEKGHLIVGQDTDFDSTPQRLGMAFAARLDKPDFVGRHALTRIATSPPDRRLVGVTLSGQPPVEGSVVRVDDEIVGYVTSSRYSPALRRSVCLAWVAYPHDATITIDGRSATIAAPPFYDPHGARLRV